jgi:adenine deaminase
LLPQFPHLMMFCSDDKHPNDLSKGHINQLVVRALKAGCDLFEILRAACVQPVEHYNLPIGLLQVGDAADFILVKDLKDFTVEKTFINGKLVAENGQTLLKSVKSTKPNKFRCKPKKVADFQLLAKSNSIQVIKALDGEIVTGKETAMVVPENGLIVSNPQNDFLKIAVINRYKEAPIAIGFIQGFGLKEGALASCVAHDSHNIVAVGTDDDYLCRAVNLVIKHRGGISAIGKKEEKILPLPIAGIMTDADGETTAKLYTEIDEFVRKKLGCPLVAPFMTLSFMALPVIPSLKMTDLGLFDVDTFGFTDVFK